MNEEVHEVYGADEPEMEHASADVDMSRGNENANKLQELDTIKMRLKELEEDAAELLEKLAKVVEETGDVQGPSSYAAIQTTKGEIDSRSVYVGNVDYACTPEKVQQHFESCGTVNRVTILTNHLGLCKCFAYVEFLEVEAVQKAVLLNESELHGRQLRVSPKRTNIPGMKQHRGRYYNSFMGYLPYYEPFYFNSPYDGYGNAPRFWRPMHHRPYY